jgi:hypothetical protein
MSTATNRSAAAVSTNHSSITPSNIEPSPACDAPLLRTTTTALEQPLPYPPFVTWR